MTSKTIAIPYVPDQRFGIKMEKTLEPRPIQVDDPKELHERLFRFLKSEADPSNPEFEIKKDFSNRFSKGHESYVFYLFECWANHYGAVISPDLLWFTMMNCFAKHVADEPEKFRNNFVDFTGQVEIAFLPESDNMDDWLDQYLEGVCQKLKLDRDGILPSFSTSNRCSKVAMKVALCDLVSPYCTGMILSCGIPKVTIQGTVEDYTKMENAAQGLAKHFSNDKDVSAFFTRIGKRASQLKDFMNGKNDGSFLYRFFDIYNCSSGSPVYEVKGWITEFMNVYVRRDEGLLLKDDGLVCGMAKFKQYGQTRMLACLAGVFHSTYNSEENILYPEFDRLWIEYNPKPNPDPVSSKQQQ